MAFSEIAQAVSTFALGAAGCLSMVKLLQVIERKRAERAEPEQKRRSSKLFPNGERDEIIAAIDELRVAGRERRREAAELKTELARIAEHLGIQL